MAKKAKPSSKIDLDGLSMDELKQLATDVQKAMANAEKRRIQEARAAVEKVAKEYGVALSDVVGAGSPRKSSSGGLPAKYRNPTDPSQTWSGRGRQPAWYKAAVEAGTDPATLEI